MQLDEILQAKSDGAWVSAPNMPTSLRFHFSDAPDDAEELQRFLKGIGGMLDIPLETMVTGGGKSPHYEEEVLVVAFSAPPLFAAWLEDNFSSFNDWFLDNGVLKIDAGDAIFTPSEHHRKVELPESSVQEEEASDTGPDKPYIM